jgi:hypothetical protein
MLCQQEILTDTNYHETTRLYLKYSEPESARPSDSLEEFTNVALSLRERVELGPRQLFRLVGVGLSNFQVDAESNSPLFDETASEEVAAVLASNK